MTTIAEFAKKHRISMRVEWEHERPDGLHHQWPQGSLHYRCTLRCLNTSKRMTVHFSQGPAHTKEPTISGVLSCLAADAAGWDNCGDFDAWASEYGYLTGRYDNGEHKRIRKMYSLVERQARALGRLLGDAYEELLYKTESE